MARAFDGITEQIRSANKKLNDLLSFSSDSEEPRFSGSSLAANTFGQRSSRPGDYQPRLKFQYYVRINYNGELADFVDSVFTNIWFDEIGTVVKNVSMPNISFDTDTMNSYNRKRLKYKKIKYDPVTINIYDVGTFASLKLWYLIYTYYFADGNLQKPLSVASDDILSEVNNLGDFGYTLESDSARKQLLKSIEIFQVQGRSYNKVTLFNPKLTTFTHDTLDYGDSSPVETKYSFDYEWAEYEFRDLKRPESEDFEIKEDSESDDMYSFFASSEVIEFAEFASLEEDLFGKGPVLDESDPSFLDQLRSARDAVKAAKNLGRTVVGTISRVSAWGNQIQMDLTGKSEPVVPLPSGRNLNAAIDKVPENRSDIRRVVRRNRGG